MKLVAAKQVTALRLFRDGRISGGLAARLLGLTRLRSRAQGAQSRLGNSY